MTTSTSTRITSVKRSKAGFPDSHGKLRSCLSCTIEVNQRVKRRGRSGTWMIEKRKGANGFVLQSAYCDEHFHQQREMYGGK